MVEAFAAPIAGSQVPVVVEALLSLISLPIEETIAGLTAAIEVLTRSLVQTSEAQIAVSLIHTALSVAVEALIAAEVQRCEAVIAASLISSVAQESGGLFQVVRFRVLVFTSPLALTAPTAG